MFFLKKYFGFENYNVFEYNGFCSSENHGS
jgi:hypothetical protein